MFNIGTGLVAMITVSVMQQIQPENAATIRSIAVFLPNYCFGQGLSDLYTNSQTLIFAYKEIDEFKAKNPAICSSVPCTPDYICKLLLTQGTTCPSINHKSYHRSFFQNGPRTGFEMCFAIGSQQIWCRWSQPKHVSNPA